MGRVNNPTNILVIDRLGDLKLEYKHKRVGIQGWWIVVWTVYHTQETFEQLTYLSQVSPVKGSRGANTTFSTGTEWTTDSVWEDMRVDTPFLRQEKVESCTKDDTEWCRDVDDSRGERYGPKGGRSKGMEIGDDLSMVSRKQGTMKSI